MRLKLLSSKVDRMFRPVTEVTAAHAAIAIMAMAVAVIVALVLRARTFTDHWVPAAIAGGVGAMMLTGAVVSWRGWSDRRDLFSGFGWPAASLLAVAGACAPPGPLAAPHALIGMTVLALGEVSAAKLVVPAGYKSFILELFAQMHYGAEATVAALAVAQVAVTAAVVLGGLAAVGGNENRRGP